MEAGLYITLNSDDPPMFNTTLSDEFRLGHRIWDWDRRQIEKLMLNAVDATLLPLGERFRLRAEFEADFARLAAGD